MRKISDKVEKEVDKNFVVTYKGPIHDSESLTNRNKALIANAV